MEVFHSKNAKLFQRLPNNTSNIGSIVTMGWPKISAYIDFQRLLFIWRVLTLPMDSIYKIVMLYRILHIYHSDHMYFGSPVCKMLQTCYRYNLLNTVITAIMNGEYVGMDKWKQWTSRIVFDASNRSCRATSFLYKSLTLLSSDSYQNGIIGWWVYSKYAPEDFKKCANIIRLLLNSYRLHDDVCTLCLEGTVNATHILFGCVMLEDRRSALWEQVLDSCPQRLADELTNMGIEARTILILNAFNCPYVREWSLSYERLCKFINIMYCTYSSAVNFKL